ncbi:MAG: type I DNA topoisomerase [Syntrophaceae bacterium]
MGKSLVIVESPTKARTIKRFLGKGFDVEATMGHIKDLPKTSLGVDIEKGFEPNYKIKPEKRDVVKRLKQAAQSAKTIYLASDPDREGEAIAWHVAEELRTPDVAIGRITFHEITQKAIDEALAHPKELDKPLYDAQMARRSMDRIVGYTMSPLLWRKVKRGLSGGRVQSVAVRLICERQDQIEAFTPVEYWTIEVTLITPDGQTIVTKVVEPKEIPDEATALLIADKIKSAPELTISEFKKKSRNRHPLPPFITSTLQQEASRRLKFTAKKTMLIAQQLYEGLPIGQGEELSGLITYMRTDSPVVSKDAVAQVREFIPAHFGKQYLPEKPMHYKAKKSAQEAHEAIRPSSVENTPEGLKAYLNKDQAALYDLIWKRFVASQMKSAVFDQTSIDIQAGDIGIRATGSVLTFDGFLKVYDVQDENDTLLPDNLKQGDVLKLEGLNPEQHFTQPPPRYNEASLIKELEDKGIGRPSTYAPIISTIQERGYVKLEGGSFTPTELGRDVNRLLVQHYPNILDVGFTARMENGLDEVEEGKYGYQETMQDFYATYQKEHEAALKDMQNIKMEQRPSGITCERCGRDLLIKLGKNGYFLGCAGYPECTNTKEFTRDEAGHIQVKESNEPSETDATCEKCGSPMVVKRGRFGPFLACSRYPECKSTRPIKEPQKIDKTCDKCGSPMVLKRGRFGPFLACSNYPECKNIMPVTTGLKCPMPGCSGEIKQQQSKKGKTFYSCTIKECKFTSWTKPVEKKCPQCSADFLVKKGKQNVCPNPECGYSEDA